MGEQGAAVHQCLKLQCGIGRRPAQNTEGAAAVRGGAEAEPTQGVGGTSSFIEMFMVKSDDKSRSNNA